jgi:hypothetical protein
LVRKIKPEAIEELKKISIAAWSLIPQSMIDKLCDGFERRLEPCLENDAESTSN